MRFPLFDHDHVQVKIDEPPSRSYLVGLFIILLWAATFRVATLDLPFHYDSSESYGSFYGVLARNYLRLKWNETYGMPVLTVGHPPNAAVTVYHDHPE